MPVKLGSKLASEGEARIEIIPLIDIMFFLLAAFMLVSLSMVNLKGLPVNLPTATTAAPNSARNLVRLAVDRAGVVYLEDRPVGNHELALMLAARHQENPELRVLLSGDQDARHGEVVRVLDLVRSVGVQQVALATRAPGEPPSP
jgi:biopolymer transport protein ExbD